VAAHLKAARLQRMPHQQALLRDDLAAWALRKVVPVFNPSEQDNHTNR